MNATKKQILSGSVLAAVALVAACGGNVVVDGSSGPGAGGGMGVGGMGVGGVTPGVTITATATATVGVGGGGCGLPSESNLSNCGGSAVAASGGMTQCTTSFCDGSTGYTYTAACSGSSCQCETAPPGNQPPMVCLCTLPGGTDACATQTNCCFN